MPMKRKRYMRQGQIRISLSVKDIKYIKELAREAQKPWKWYLGYILLPEAIELYTKRKLGTAGPPLSPQPYRTKFEVTSRVDDV